jgi:hypothetical protein
MARASAGTSGCSDMEAAATLPSLVLERAELEQLTETVQPKRMAAWLQERGWKFEPGRGLSALPRVDRTYYLARMSGREQAPQRVGPNLGFFSRSV